MYQIMPPLTEKEFDELKEDIKGRGIIVPIEVDENGDVLDGHHRLQAWQELRAEGTVLPDYPRVVRAGMTEIQKRNHIRALNIVRRHLTPEQCAELWLAMRLDGMSPAQIADASGVSDDTVRAKLSSVSENSETELPNETIGKDGKKRPTKYHKRKIEKPKPPAAPLVSVYAGSDEGEAKAISKARKVLDAPSAASQPVQTIIFSSDSNEYYTPPQYIEAAKEVMGGIDLDPASCDVAQEWIKANSYHTVKDDGLNQPWHGRIWLNPPYGKEGNESCQEIWSQHLINQYEGGDVSEAILLVKAALGYHWFEYLWWNWPTCFCHERVSFIRPDGSDDGQSKMATAFIYLGPNVERFKNIFRQFGRVIMPEEQGQRIE